jgi:hypothetical protein
MLEERLMFGLHHVWPVDMGPGKPIVLNESVEWFDDDWEEALRVYKLLSPVYGSRSKDGARLRIIQNVESSDLSDD